MGPRDASLWFRLLVALVCLGEVACAASPQRSGDLVAEEHVDRDVVLLTVDNQDFKDATIYARWNGERTQLGTVTGKSQQTFELKWRSHTIYIEVDFVAGGRYRSNTIDVSRGDHLKFIIGPG